MQQAHTVSIAASLPIQVNPTSTEIVFCPESNSYSLSLGVNVQLPIHELVDVLLKFNAEHVVPNSISDVESSHSQSLLASLPEATPYEFPDSPVYTPKASSNSGTSSKKLIRETSYADDDFMRVPITVARQDPMLLDYRERTKWHREFGRFFVENAFKKQDERMDRFTQALQRYDELPVAEEFRYEYATTEMKPSSSSIGGKRLSADAPVFTPGSAFASTYASDSIRERALSENFAEAAPGGTRDRVMSNLSYLPPSAVVEEAFPEAPVSSEIASFWSRVASAAPPQSIEREESRPAECKQM
jgi:hypothetical protein